MQERPVQIDKQDARQGRRGMHVSAVLGISFTLAVIIGVIFYLGVY